MAFNISYIIQARDQFSAIAKRVQGSVGKLQRKFAKLSLSLRQTGDRMVSFGQEMALKVSLPIALLGRHLVTSASDAQEANTKFDTIFKNIKDKANETAATFAKTFGQSRVGAKQMLGATADLLTGLDVSQKKALSLSKSVNELAVDLASFNNYAGGAAGASRALTKAMLGETDSVKELGIVIRQDLIEKKVAQMKAKGLRFETEMQAKAYAVLSLAQAQSKNAIGDFARTQDSFANRMRVFKSRLQDVSVTLGEILLPFATKAINIFVSLADKFEAFTVKMKAFAAANPEITKMILSFIGFLAVVGPLILGLGLLLKTIGFIMSGFALLKPLLTGVAFGFKLLSGGANLLLLGFNALPKIMAGARAAMLALNAAFAANPIGIVVAAIAALVAGVVWAYNEFETFRNMVDNAWASIKAFSADAWDGFMAAVQKTGDVITTYLIEPIKYLIGLIGKVTSALSNISMSGVMDKVSSGVSKVGSFFGFGGDDKKAPVASQSVAANSNPVAVNGVKSESKSDVTINLKGNTEAIKSVESKTKGPTNLKVGKNMAMAG